MLCFDFVAQSHTPPRRAAAAAAPQPPSRRPPQPRHQADCGYRAIRGRRKGAVRLGNGNLDGNESDKLFSNTFPALNACVNCRSEVESQEWRFAFRRLRASSFPNYHRRGWCPVEGAMGCIGVAGRRAGRAAGAFAKLKNGRRKPQSISGGGASSEQPIRVARLTTSSRRGGRATRGPPHSTSTSARQFSGLRFAVSGRAPPPSLKRTA